MCPPAQAQSVVLGLESKEVIQGQEFTIMLLGNIDKPIRGFQVGIEYPQYAMTLVDASLDGTVLSGRRPSTFNVFKGQGYATMKVAYDSAPLLENPIAPGSSLYLVRLRFLMSDGLEPGATYQVALKSGLGYPAVIAIIFAGGGFLSPAGLESGEVKVIDDNILRIRDIQGVIPGSVQTVEISAINKAPLQGFSIGVKFDPTVVRFLELDLTGTITQAMEAEYVVPLFDNTRGQFILGVLIDSLPPVENRAIPATGLDLTLAKVKVQVLQEVPAGSGGIELILEDGLGLPPIRNLFVIDNQSVAPIKQNGRLELVSEAPFLRGDVNADGKVDISDPIATGDWIFRGSRQVICQKRGDSNDDGKVTLEDMVFTLLYLFTSQGRILPQPFPRPGFDPTPDGLACPVQ